jgi:hypothetical protein
MSVKNCWPKAGASIDSLGDGFEPKQAVLRGIEHFTPLRSEDGYLLLPEAPGLGIDLDEEAIAHHPPTIPSEPPHLRRPDGAVQDW